ncbi:MAG TPA: hypothetical protein VGN97_16930 [Mesorhizobium sp.]|jgi:hypothetical protein|nr:hypothetical protein [Mesorhizobium sp.]
MRVDGSSLQLLSQNLGARAGGGPKADQGIAALAGRYGAARAGLNTSDAKLQPKFSYETRFREEARYETRAVTENRDVLREEAVEEVRDVYATRDVVEERTRFVSRDITETRDVFETRDVIAARVEGTKSLSETTSTLTAGISKGSGFSIQTADGGQVEVKFDSATSLTVKVGKETTKINFGALDGSFKQALVDGLNASGAVSASWSAEGKLVLSDASAMTIKSVGGSSALNALGITAGTTNPSVVGTEQVKVGTQQVKVGTEQVADGTEQVVVGTESYVTGTERVIVGTRQVKIGTEQVVTGTERVKVGTERVADGIERKLVGLERMAAMPSLWGSDNAPKKLLTSVVDVIADTVKFGQSRFSNAEARSAYDFGSSLEKDEEEPQFFPARRGEMESFRNEGEEKSWSRPAPELSGV